MMLYEKFCEIFLRHYKSSLNKAREDLAIEGMLGQPIRGSVIAADDEALFKNWYHASLNASHRNRNVAVPPVVTLNETKRQMQNEGLTEAIVDFIPLSEQELEIELLLKQGRVTPRGWTRDGIT